MTKIFDVGHIACSFLKYCCATTINLEIALSDRADEVCGGFIRLFPAGELIPYASALGTRVLGNVAFCGKLGKV